jgi:hypothetical protein
MISTRRIGNLVLRLLVFLVLAVPLVFAGKAPGKGNSLLKTATSNFYTPFLINNVFNYYGNNGDGSINNYRSDAEGFEFPKGSGQNVIYEDGVVWGGYHGGTATGVLKVGGSTYNHGLQPGAILAPGTSLTSLPTFDAPDAVGNRIYRVRPDVNPHTPFANVQDVLNNEEVPFIIRYLSTSAKAIYDQYVKDWNEWPAAQGAPYTDVNGDGKYDPAIDIPGRPGADQTLWYVANDVNAGLVNGLYGSDPIGIEMQKTIWGYKRTGALGNTIFISTIVINKSGVPLDSTFLVQWADPDLGYAGDDFVGCDTTKNLGFVYNGAPVDKNYGVAVPAGGFVFFQGPRVPAPGDSAVWKGKRIYGWKNLPMSAFFFFTQGNAKYADPPLGPGNGGDAQFYNLMNGLIASNGAPFTDPNTGKASKFCMPGNPVTGQGWLDGQEVGPQDRRLGLVSGPFNLAPGDTQELVVANLAAQGKDRFSSVSLLYWYTDLAQYAYNQLFDLASPPPQPVVKFAALDKEIVLSWGDTSSTKIESFVSKGYFFEGYNVYQLPGPSFANPVRLVTYDKRDGVTLFQDLQYDDNTGYVILKPVEFGTDNGISHNLDIRTDAIKQVGLLNGTNYYFAVTAYSVDTTAGVKPAYLESPAVILKDTLPFSTGIVPHSKNPGFQLAGFGDTIGTAHTGGTSTGVPVVAIVDPGRLPNGNYEIQVFTTPGDSVFNSDLGVKVGNPQWQVMDLGASKVVIPPNRDFSNTGTKGSHNLMLGGLQVNLVGAPFYKAGFEIAKQEYIPGSDMNWAGVNWGGSQNVFKGTTFEGAVDLATNFRNSILGPLDVTMSIEVRFTKTGQGQKAYAFLRPTSGGTAASAYEGFYDQPFTVWNVTDPKNAKQVDFAFLEAAGNVPNTNHVWQPGTDPGGGQREYWFMIDEPYSATEKAAYASAANQKIDAILGTQRAAYGGWYVLKDAGKPPYQPGDVWRISPTAIITTADKWDFSSPAGHGPVYTPSQARADVTKINVFPNPYIGFNPQEINRYARWVTFTHLPQNATVRIFNLAGVLVRALVKSDNSQMIQWDLNNTSGYPVAAGMYIVYIDMPDLGVTKTLKLGVIPEQQYLDRY